MTAMTPTPHVDRSQTLSCVVDIARARGGTGSWRPVSSSWPT
jgi:hypothetical protein